MELGELGESMQEQERLVLFLVERNLLVSGATIEEIGSREEGQEDRCLVGVFSGRTEDGVLYELLLLECLPEAGECAPL